MKRNHIARTGLALVLAPFALSAAPAGDSQPPPAAELQPRQVEPDLRKENLKLRREVELLRSRVARLEARVKELEAGKPPAPRAVPRPTPPQVVPKSRVVPRQPNPLNPAEPRPLPDGWQEREFNGMKFYIVPLKPGETKPATTRPAAVEPAAPR